MEQVSIKSVKHSKWRYKIVDLHLYEKLKNSIRQNGQIYPLVVREVQDGYEIIDGNQRLSIFNDLNHETVGVKNMGIMREIDALKKAVEINTCFTVDDIHFAGVVTELLKEYDAHTLSMTFPNRSREITEYPRLFHFDWSTFSGEDQSQGELNFD